MAEYRFQGSLRGCLCRDCDEAIDGVTVRLYQAARDVAVVVAQAVANPKDTFTLLTDEQVKEKQSRLIAEATTNEDGSFAFALGREQKYGGQAFEIDVYCGTVPGRKPTPQPPQPRQFSITTLQPQWRQGSDGAIFGWQYVIPCRFWCYLRGLFGAWTVCGHVTVCDTHAPLGGVRVSAFDVDWLQNDPLGSAVTNGAGHFRIDYAKADFEKTIFSWINVELTSGPDLYFRVETLGGTALLTEPPARGRSSDRENVGPCFCVDLCVPRQPENPSDPETVLSAFTHLGAYRYSTDIDSTPAGTGLTNGDHRAFFSDVRLNGVLAKRLNTQPLEYRFEVRELPGGVYTPVTAPQIARTKIGVLERFAPDFPGDPSPVKTIDYTVNGTASATERVTTFSPDGWIRVPQEGNVFGIGNFVPDGNMIRLITTTLAAFADRNMTGLVAGANAVPIGPLVQNRHFGLRMQVREAGNPASAIFAGECANVAVNNVKYDQVKHHPSWAGFTADNQLGVNLIDVQELLSAGCQPLTDTLTVLFSAVHPTLGTVGITMTGPGGPYPFTLPPAVPGQQFGTAVSNGWMFASLPACAYLLTLQVQVLLTTGDGVPSDLFDQIAFCKDDAI